MNTIFGRKGYGLPRFNMIILLTVALFLTGIYTGKASTQDELILALEKKVTASDAAAGDNFGRSVSISGDTAIVGANNDDGKGSAYIFERGGTGWIFTTKITADDGSAGDNFGFSVAISGDTAIVGADEDDDNGSESGSAYIFYRNQGGADNWGQVKKITAGDGAADDNFGWSVAIRGDTAIVGALWDDDNGSESGSAYIFYRNHGGADNWGQVKKLTAGDAAGADQFGTSIAIWGDRAIIGAPWDDDNGSESGSAYIFERNHGGADNWGQAKKIISSDGVAFDLFGLSVAIFEDTTLIGANLDDSKGSAYIFYRNQGGADNWGEVTKLVASDCAAEDYFGASVAISGDTAIIGAFGDDDNGSYSGSAYIFERNRGGTDYWGQARKLTASDGAAFAYFGWNWSVAISSDTAIVGAYMGDSTQGSAYLFHLLEVPENKVVASDGGTPEEFGFAVAVQGDTAIVGAQYDDDNGFASGSGYIYGRSGDSWTEAAKLLPGDGASLDYFGSAVTIWGDTAVVGAWGDDDNGSNSGSIYIFYRNQGGADNWGQKKKIIPADGVANDYFGFSVSLCEDTLIVGAWQLSGNGVAYIYYRNTGGADNWGFVKKITASDTAFGDMFGYSVFVSGDSAVVGAYANDDAGSLSGSAYIFDRNQGGSDNWGEVKKLTAFDAAGDDRFGYSVSISGDLAVVGAIYDDDNGSNSGSAYLFDRNAGGSNNWGVLAKLLPGDGYNDDLFGTSIAVSGDTVIIGSNQDDDAGSISGSAYIFHRNAGGSGNWGQSMKLTASDAASGDLLGTSVAISGDTAAVGAYHDDDNGADSGSAYFYELGLAGPVVQSITRYDPLVADTNADTVTFMITFDEMVHNLRLTNLDLSVTLGQSTAAISTISSSCGITMTVSVATVPDGDGTIRLDLATTPTIINNWFMPIQTTFYSGETFDVDRLKPTVLMSSTAPEPTDTLPIPVTVTFSEAVTGFQESDVSISNGSLTNFSTVNAYTYTFDITGCSSGEVTADIAGDAANDAVGNPNSAATQFSRTYQVTGVEDWFLY